MISVHQLRKLAELDEHGTNITDYSRDFIEKDIKFKLRTTAKERNVSSYTPIQGRGTHNWQEALDEAKYGKYGAPTNGHTSN